MSEKTIWICHNCGADWPSESEPDHCYRCSKKHEMFNTGYTEKEWNAKNDKEKEEIRSTYYNAKKAKMYENQRKMIYIILAIFAVFMVICFIIIGTHSSSSYSSHTTQQWERDAEKQGYKKGSDGKWYFQGHNPNDPGWDK